EAARCDEQRQRFKLLDQFVIELAPALIGREQFLPVGRRAYRVPADQNGAGVLGVIEPQQDVGKADDRPTAAVAAAADRLRQAMIGAMAERIAVYDEQGPGHCCADSENRRNTFSSMRE